MKTLRYSAMAFAVVALGACADQSPTAVDRDLVIQAEAHASEQVIFSGVATTNSTFGSPVGFWIWCEAESDNPYDEECNGAMYFYGLRITRHVEGEVEEPSEGIYEMTVESTRDQTISCTLINAAEAVHGPRNTVTVTCTTPAGTATSTNAVVNVTGPGD